MKSAISLIVILAGLLILAAAAVWNVTEPQPGQKVDLGALRYQATQVEKNLGE